MLLSASMLFWHRCLGKLYFISLYWRLKVPFKLRLNYLNLVLHVITVQLLVCNTFPMALAQLKIIKRLIVIMKVPWSCCFRHLCGFSIDVWAKCTLFSLHWRLEVQLKVEIELCNLCLGYFHCIVVKDCVCECFWHLCGFRKDVWAKCTL